jgi:hypothetical protein
MDTASRYIREPNSASGDFYVEDGCCLSCGVPQTVAPDLVGWVNNEKMVQCFWKKQPETHEEIQQAFAIFDGQEAGCHRYAGRDPEIQMRIGIENCDHVLIGPEQGVRRWGPLWEKISEIDTHKAGKPTEAGFLPRLWSKIWRRSGTGES